MADKKRVAEAIATLVSVFQEYASKDTLAGKEKDKFKLSRREFKKLMQKECGLEPPEKTKDPAAVKALMKELDKDGDGQLDFKEFAALVVETACACNATVEELMNQGI